MPIWPHTWRSSGIAADTYGVAAPIDFLKIVTILSVAGGTLLVICIGYAALKSLKEKDNRIASWQFGFGIVGSAVFSWEPRPS